MRQANHSLVTKDVYSNGKTNIDAIEKKEVIWPCGKGNGTYATLRAWLYPTTPSVTVEKEKKHAVRPQVGKARLG